MPFLVQLSLLYQRLAILRCQNYVINGDTLLINVNEWFIRGFDAIITADFNHLNSFPSKCE